MSLGLCHTAMWPSCTVSDAEKLRSRSLQMLKTQWGIGSPQLRVNLEDAASLQDRPQPVWWAIGVVSPCLGAALFIFRRGGCLLFSGGPWRQKDVCPANDVMDNISMTFTQKLESFSQRWSYFVCWRSKLKFSSLCFGMWKLRVCFFCCFPSCSGWTFLSWAVKSW